MGENFDHTVLIVDDDEQLGKALGRLMKGIGAKYVYMASGQEALDWMEKASKPFSLILSDQRMPGMEGSVFLEKAKKIAPDTLRILIADVSELQTLVSAVNSAGIHSCLTLPFRDEDLLSQVKQCCKQYETNLKDDPFLIAQGRDAKYPKNAEIRYHFPTDFLHAGKVNQDGSINFMDRGEIPHVADGTFLAAKIFPEQGLPGVDVFGKSIVVDEPYDLAFSSGPGTRLSEEGVRIYAAASGNMAAFQKVSKTVKETRINAKEAEETINRGFDRQDEIALEISQKKGRMEEL